MIRVNSSGNAYEARTPVQAASDLGVLHDVGRNRFHNPVLRICQRGSGSWTANNAYTSDRWILGVGGTDSNTVTVQTATDADRAAVGDEQVENLLQSVFGGSSTASCLSAVSQRMEHLRRFSNKTVTISFWAKASSGTPKIGVGVQQFFGAGGTPSSTVNANIGVTGPLSTTWTRYSVTGTIPSVSGKTFGSTLGTDWLSVDFFLSCPSANTTFYSESGSLGVQSGTVQFWGMQFEVGSVITPLDIPDIMLDIANCQRFYQTGQFTQYGYQGAGAAVGGTWPFPVLMRAAPTVVTTTVSNTNVSAYTVTASGGNVSLVFSGTATATGGYILNDTFTASADL
jgi:hypothetical protein